MSGEVTMSPIEGLLLRHEAGVITLCDANTTVGYCRYAEDGEVEYLFVQRARRRQGLATLLLSQVEQQTGVPLRFREPLSPMGDRLRNSYELARKIYKGNHLQGVESNV